MTKHKKHLLVEYYLTENCYLYWVDLFKSYNHIFSVINTDIWISKYILILYLYIVLSSFDLCCYQHTLYDFHNQEIESYITNIATKGVKSRLDK